MAQPAATSSVSPAAWLELGQTLESSGKNSDALGAYDRALAELSHASTSLDVLARRTLGLVWMNRGNALQKIATPASVSDAIRAYDEAIAVFRTLPVETEPAFRNHLGAAWLNRGHALLANGNPAQAVASFEQAIAHLEKLPLGAADISYVLNLSGAHTNLALALLGSDPVRARTAARHALGLLEDFSSVHPALAGMKLRATRAFVMATGELLVVAEAAGESITALAAEAGDALDQGLAFARLCETQGLAHFRPLAARLFRLGAHFYRIHQPHFLAEFLQENLDHPAFALDPEFQTVAREATALALAEARRPQRLVAGTTESNRLLETVRALRTLQERFSAPPISSALPS